MTTQTGECPAVTDRAGSLVERLLLLLTAMRLEKVRGVTRRLQVSTGLMTERTTERWINLAMTDQAVSHCRIIPLAHCVGLVKPAMAGFASIRAIQVPPDVAGE